jgi:hypothetical protein
MDPDGWLAVDSDARPGDLLHVGRTASVQFEGERALTFRVIRALPDQTYTGWIWLEGYVLGPGGQAVDQRQIFVQSAGLRLLERAGSSRSHRGQPTRRRSLR